MPNGNEQHGQNEKKRSDYPFWILIAVAVAVIIILLVTKGNGGRNGDGLADGSPSPSVSVSPVGSNPPPSGLPAGASDYNSLLSQFSGRRIVFDSSCNIMPDTTSFKNMTQIMLDNKNSTKPLSVKIGERDYNLVAGGWYLTTLYSYKLPADLAVSCDGKSVGSFSLTQ
jgi:hypothetical protein